MFSRLRRIFLMKVRKEVLGKVGNVEIVKRTYFLSDKEKPVTIEIQEKTHSLKGEEEEKPKKRLSSYITIRQASEITGLSIDKIRYYQRRNAFVWKKTKNLIQLDKHSFMDFYTELTGS